MKPLEERILRQRSARDLRKCPDDDQQLLLVIDYATLYYCLRLPTLQEIDILLREEGTHDVVKADEVLNTVVSMHPAHTIVLRLHSTHGGYLPEDGVISLAIKDEIARACTPTPQTSTQMNGINTDLLSRLDDANYQLRLERLSMLEVLEPQRVRYIWQLCQAMGFDPFPLNTTQVS